MVPQFLGEIHGLEADDEFKVSIDAALQPYREGARRTPGARRVGRQRRSRPRTSAATLESLHSARQRRRRGCEPRGRAPRSVSSTSGRAPSRRRIKRLSRAASAQGGWQARGAAPAALGRTRSRRVRSSLRPACVVNTGRRRGPRSRLPAVTFAVDAIDGAGPRRRASPRDHLNGSSAIARPSRRSDAARAAPAAHGSSPPSKATRGRLLHAPVGAWTFESAY